MRSFLSSCCGFLIAAVLMTWPVPMHAAPGDVDPSFDPGSGVDNRIFAIALQPDGKMIIGGEITTVDGLVRKGVARLNNDGSGDPSFSLVSITKNFTPAPVVRSVVVQPDGKIIFVGDFHSVNGASRNGIARLNADGTLDGGFNPGTGANNVVFSAALQNDGKVLIGGVFTTINGTNRDGIARLNTDGGLDNGFSPGTGGNGVLAIAVQTDGKVLIGGTFTGNGRIRIARLHTDGILDTSFNPGTGANNNVNAVVLQPDGKVLIGGTFGMVDNTSRPGIARLNANGSLDSGFIPGISALTNSIALQADGKVLIGAANVGAPNITRLNSDGGVDGTFNPGTGVGGFADSRVHSLVLQADGKVVIGGRFWRVNGITRNWIARVGADGVLDSSFEPQDGVTGGDFPRVFAVAPLANGKVVIGGAFTTIDGVSRNGIARLNADGTLDTNFNPGTGVTGTSFVVSAVTLQPDGKVVIGGVFSMVDGVTRPGIARLNADGSLDSSFSPTGPSSAVNSIALQADGKILIGGTFFTLSGVSRNSVARLNTDGSLDASFNPGTGASLSPGTTIYSLKMQPDGKVLVAGDFTSFNGSTRNRVARLNTDGSVDGSFDPGGGPDGAVNNLALQPDGKVLLGGSFATVSGASRLGIARLNSNGSHDTGFNPSSVISGILSSPPSLALQADGKVVVGGGLVFLLDTNFSGVARLNTDGSRDMSFNAPILAPNNPVDPGFIGVVIAVAVSGDGSILIGGSFTKLNNTARWRVARLFGDLPPGTVHCALSSLQSAIDAAQPGSILNVLGTCNENILVRNEKQRITLNGGGAAIISAPNAGTPAMNVRGKGILIQGFTIIGGSHGVHVNRGSNAVIQSNHIQSAVLNGVIVDELAFAVLTGNTIENNVGSGIFVGEGSTARIGFNSDTETVASANTITNNGIGVFISNGSSARVIGNTIESNTGAGVQVSRDSEADIASNAIDANGDGIVVEENSLVQLGEDSGTNIFESANTTTTTNMGFGITCTNSGIAGGRRGSLTGNSGATSFHGSCINSLAP